MTIQFNLLPDVKLQYLKTKRQQRVVIALSIIACIAAVSVFLILISVVYGVQRKSMNDLNKDITKNISTLKGTQDLDKILTIQNQMKRLPELHDSKVVSSRLYNYLSQVTPNEASIGGLTIDFTQSTLVIKGTANELATINRYVDTFKFTTYGEKGQSSKMPAFSDVVLSKFSRDDKDATYEISLKFVNTLFSGGSEVELSVPKIITTRSQMERPAELFKALPEGSQVQ